MTDEFQNCAPNLTVKADGNQSLSISNQRNLGHNRRPSVTVQRNAHLTAMSSDYLYHVGLIKEDAAAFSEIRYVVIGGSEERMQKFAEDVAVQLAVDCQSVGAHNRYVLFKCGPILVGSHGMGGPSISILLHELSKLLLYAGADCVWIRIGTCGGLGLPPGSVVLTEESLNGALEPWHETIILGKRTRRTTKFNPELNDELRRTCEDLGLKAHVGKTMCCDDFYEGQARLDGAICDYDEEDKLKFLENAHKVGVINIEMESLQFGAFCNQMKVSSAVIVVTLLNRLAGDQVTSTSEQLAEFEARPIRVVVRYILSDYDEYQK